MKVLLDEPRVFVTYGSASVFCGDDPYEAGHSEQTPDAYLLQFWPAAPAPDRILRQTSPRAAYWHRAHRGRPLPAAEQEAEDRTVSDEHHRYLREKYGEIPDARLQAIDGYTVGLLLIDRELVLALAELDDDVLGQVARWSALRALSVAGLTEHPVTAPAVAALRAGQPLPAPFDDEFGYYSVVEALMTRTYVPRLPVLEGEPGAEEEQQLYALSTLGTLAGGNPLAVAAGIVEGTAIAFGPDHYLGFLADLRVEFPQCHRSVRPDGRV